MRVVNLTEKSRTYTSNAYFIRGEWNSLKDMNTLIDTGRDPLIFSKLEKISSGVGKAKIEKVLLTHGHYDHTSNLRKIKKLWNPKVFALSQSIKGITHLVYDQMTIRVGDREAIVIVCPGHSSDSVCYYVPDEKALFSGDTQLTDIRSGAFEKGYIQCLEKISHLDVDIIYPGHGKPIISGCNKKIMESLNHVRKSCGNDLSIHPDQKFQSHYQWFNIEMNNQRVGKMRSKLNDDQFIIHSIIIFPEFRKKGIANCAISFLKKKYSGIIADKVRYSAKGFWEKMNFVDTHNGNFLWVKKQNNCY